MKRKDTIADWVAWTFYAFLISLLLHGVRRWLFSSVYETATRGQELLIFAVLTAGILFLLVRPVAHSMREEKNRK